jgi:hypothetical protein
MSEAKERWYVRHAIGVARPYVHGPMSLPDFLRQVFGAVELEGYGFGPDSAHVELLIGDSVMAVEAGFRDQTGNMWWVSTFKAG